MNPDLYFWCLATLHLAFNRTKMHSTKWAVLFFPLSSLSTLGLCRSLATLGSAGGCESCDGCGASAAAGGATVTSCGSLAAGELPGKLLRLHEKQEVFEDCNILQFYITIDFIPLLSVLGKLLFHSPKSPGSSEVESSWERLHRVSVAQDTKWTKTNASEFLPISHGNDPLKGGEALKKV